MILWSKNKVYPVDRFESIRLNLSIIYSIFTDQVFLSWWYSIMQLSSVAGLKTNGNWDKKTNQFFVIPERNCIFLGSCSYWKHIPYVRGAIGVSIERKCILSGFQEIWHESRVIYLYIYGNHVGHILTQFYILRRFLLFLRLQLNKLRYFNYSFDIIIP